MSDLKDSRGYTLLHESAFHNDEDIVKDLLIHARENLTSKQLADWTNEKTDADGFCALHFASFKGNVSVCDELLKAGADLTCRNNFGIDVMHVAAQGDQPISLFFFKQKGCNIRSRDNRNSTPLHWACYSKSEVALVYLLSWQKELNDKDCEGYTPLHLAVKSVETLHSFSTRPVRSLLIRGASRTETDMYQRKPIDLADLITSN